VNDDEKLLEEYVAVFPKYDPDFDDPEEAKRVTRVVTSEPVLAALETELPSPFPPLFRALLLNYRYSPVDFWHASGEYLGCEIDKDAYELLPNPPGPGLKGFREKMLLDPHLWPTLLENGFLQFGRGGGGDYDPVCFDTAGGMAVVELDHEEILMHRKIKVLRTLAAGFRELVEQTIARAPALRFREGSPMHTAYGALGANLGDREANIRRAIELLAADGKVRVAAVSRLVETEPAGCPPGSPGFVNGVARIETKLGPRDLLARMLAVERAMGRARGEVRGAPRAIDLDLLLCDETVCDLSAGEGTDAPALALPHPRMLERPFVMEPLSEVAPPETLEWVRRRAGGGSE